MLDATRMCLRFQLALQRMNLQEHLMLLRRLLQLVLLLRLVQPVLVRGVWKLLLLRLLRQQVLLRLMQYFGLLRMELTELMSRRHFQEQFL
jgi:hypothetical protein